MIPAVTMLEKFLSRDDSKKTAGVCTMGDELSSAFERRFEIALKQVLRIGDDGHMMLLNEIKSGPRSLNISYGN